MTPEYNNVWPYFSVLESRTGEIIASEICLSYYILQLLLYNV